MKSKEAQPSLVLVGPLPPPYSGPSVHFQMLVEEMYKRPIFCVVVNLGSKKSQSNVFRWGRVWEYMGILRDYVQKTVFGKKTVYILIAQSRRGFFRDLFMIWFAWLSGHRIVCHLRGGNYGNFYAAQPRWLQWLIRQTLRRTDAILVLSERLTSLFDFEPLLKPKIHVVPNGLPFEVPTPVEPKTLPADPSEPVRLLFLSNLIESKGYLDLLEAVHILVSQYGLNVRCHFCGTFWANPSDDVRVKSAEHGRKLFEDYVREHGLREYVRYRGPVSGVAKNDELRQAHFFVLPTNYDNEGQPVSIIEAMAYGNLVISTDYRAIPDLVVDGVTGRLVPYGQPAAVAQAIADLMANPRQYRDMSRAAIERYQQRFTREAYLACIMPRLQASAA
jgi:glycosyltransferase involved in cell wall biosynthesis